jgi:hypothetical protein
MSSIRALTDAAAEAVNLFHRFLGPFANSPDPRATVVLSDTLREYVSPGPYGPCADGIGPAQIAAAERWPCPGAMECAINDTIRFCGGSGLRHGEGVNLAPIAFRAYADLLLDRERLINPSRLRSLHHAAVHEAKTWNTSMPLVIERIDAVVDQIKALATLPSDLDPKRWSPIHRAARDAIEKLRPFEQRNTPTTPDHLQIARFMEATRATYELCDKARHIPPMPMPDILPGKNSVTWCPDGERSVLLECEPTAGPLLKLRNNAAREALLWGAMAPTIEMHVRALWDATQAMMSVARDSTRSTHDWATAFESWCHAFDRLTPFSGLAPAITAAADSQGEDEASASAIPRRPSSVKPRRHQDDELLAQWEAFKARQGVNEDRVVILDFYEAELKGRTDLTLSGVEKAIENGRQRRSRARRKTPKRR